MTLVLADGTTAKSGSHAVKNVAGYDIHKLMIGARGTLAVVAEVILRTYPLKSLPTPNVRQTLGSGAVQAPCQWIQRVKRSDFAQATAIAGSFAGIDIPATSTIWRSLPEGIELSRFEGDWVLRSNCGPQNLTVTDGTVLRYMKRTKAIFDPTGKLNPGAMGVF
jgi:glycolate oxidase FAD binding subunit